MNGATPRFWAGPLRYCRWAARERPGIFWALFIGALGPVTLITVPPIRRRVGDYDAAPIPMTYPGMSAHIHQPHSGHWLGGNMRGG
jgi:hypothetical protein